MRVIATLNQNRENGNDCYIYEEWTLIRVFGKDKILHTTCENGYEFTINHYTPEEQPKMYEILREIQSYMGS
jgi:hypothetical protein